MAAIRARGRARGWDSRVIRTDWGWGLYGWRVMGRRGGVGLQTGMVLCVKRVCA